MKILVRNFKIVDSLVFVENCKNNLIGDVDQLVWMMRTILNITVIPVWDFSAEHLWSDIRYINIYLQSFYKKIVKKVSFFVENILYLVEGYIWKEYGELLCCKWALVLANCYSFLYHNVVLVFFYKVFKM